MSTSHRTYLGNETQLPSGWRGCTYKHFTDEWLDSKLALSYQLDRGEVDLY